MRGTAPLPFFVISEPRPWITGLCSAPDHLARPSGWDQLSGVGAGGGGGLRGFAGQGPGAGWGGWWTGCGGAAHPTFSLFLSPDHSASFLASSAGIATRVSVEMFSLILINCFMTAFSFGASTIATASYLPRVQ